MSEQFSNEASPEKPGKTQENIELGTMNPWEFTGRSGEYFNIWIVNIFLTIITLGVYSAWAKVRRNRYMLGNLKIAGHGMQYRATGFAILKGRAIAFIVLSLYFALSVESEIAAWLGSLVLVCALPWVVHLAMAFRCRVISWNNVRFRWHGSPLIMVKAFLPYLIGYFPTVLLFLYYLTLGADEPEGLSRYTDWTDSHAPPLAGQLACQFFFLAMLPVGIYTLARALIRNTSWGDLFLDDMFSFGSVVAHTAVYLVIPILIATLIVGIGFFLVYFGIHYFSIDLSPDGGLIPDEAVGKIIFWVELLKTSTALAAFSVHLLLVLVFKTVLRNLIFNNTVARERSTGDLQTDVSIRFSSDVSWWRIMWIHVGNLVAILCSAFFLYPWAVIRLKKYIATRSATKFHKDISKIVEERQAKTSAAASEYTDLGGIDVSPW